MGSLLELVVHLCFLPHFTDECMRTDRALQRSQLDVIVVTFALRLVCVRVRGRA